MPILRFGLVKAIDLIPTHKERTNLTDQIVFYAHVIRLRGEHVAHLELRERTKLIDKYLSGQNIVRFERKRHIGHSMFDVKLFFRQRFNVTHLDRISQQTADNRAITVLLIKRACLIGQAQPEPAASLNRDRCKIMRRIKLHDACLPHGTRSVHHAQAFKSCIR